MEPKRIQKIFPVKIYVQNLPRYYDVVKKNYKICGKITVACPSGTSFNRFEKINEMQSKLIKLLRATKYVQALNLKKFKVWEVDNNLPRTAYTAKMMHRVTKLSINDVFSSKKSIQILGCWFKNINELKHFNYLMNDPRGLDQRKEDVVYIQEIKDIIKTMKQNKVTNLKIQLEITNPSILKSFFTFSDYPPSLKKLAIYSKSYLIKSDFESPELNILQTKTHSLSSLCLKFPLKMQLSPFFTNNIMNLTDLSTLKLVFQSNIAANIFPILNRIKEFKMLKKLSLKFEKWSEEIKNLLEFVKECPLKHLSLILVIEKEDQLIPLVNLIAHFKHLELIKLHIFAPFLFTENDKLRDLVQHIFKLQMAKFVNFSAYTSAKMTKKNHLQTLIPSPDSIPPRQVALKRFSFESNQVEPGTNFLGLLDFIKPQASNLYKLKINVGAYDPKKTELDHCTDFIRDLKNIQILRLDSLNIYGNQFLQAVIDAVFTLQYLRVLMVGKIKGSITKHSFAEAFERFICKSGMNQFICDITLEFQKSLANKTKNLKIDVDKVVRKNPYIKSINLAYLIFLPSKISQQWETPQ